MSTDRETTSIVRSWLEEGVTALPDRVLDAVLDQVPATPQRRSWWPPRRSALMNSYAKTAIATAAVLVVAVVGYNLLPGNGDIGGPPTPVPTSSPGPTAITFTTSALRAPVAGGRYALQVGAPGDGRYFPLELTLPAGWVPQKLDVDEVAFDGPNAAGLFLGFYSVQRVYRDPCHPEDGWAGNYLGGSNTQDLVNELRGLVGFDAGSSSTVPLGDLQATHFVISNTIDTRTAGCTDGALLPLFTTWTADHSAERTARGDKSPATNGGTAQEIWIVDRGDLYPLLIVGEAGRSPEAGRATLDAIVASIIIESTGVEPTGSLP